MVIMLRYFYSLPEKNSPVDISVDKSTRIFDFTSSCNIADLTRVSPRVILSGVGWYRSCSHGAANLFHTREETMPTSPCGEVILIIDDDECIRDSCHQALSRVGYRVEMAMNGETGLMKAREIKPDVALVDINMPGVSGLEVMDQLSEISPGIIKIVVTGDTSIDLEEKVIKKRRAVSYLVKPFSPDQLNSVVQKALDSREERKRKEDFHVP
jgi:CheY-like chemotaxis protein